MKHIQQKLLAGFLTILLLGRIVTVGTQKIFAVSTIHVRILGSARTIFTGDVTPGGCTITDESNVSHIYANPLAICALDSASKQGNFTYQVKDFGGNLGLFVDAIAEDKGAQDFSTFWTYDLNGQSAQNGVSNQSVKAGDILYFHFSDPNADVNQRAVNDGISYLKSQQNSDGSIKGFSGLNGWAAMAFSAAGTDINLVKNGNTSLLDYLNNNPPANNAAATEFEKYVLAITAAGKNPFDFNAVNYEAKVESFANNNQLGSITQLNDDFFGELALIASGPSASSTLETNVLSFIVGHSNTDGGFSWSTTGSSDTNDTAAALQAMIAAKNHNITVTGLDTAITNAKTYMLSNQNKDGGFPYSPGDASDTSSTSWCAMALSALGLGNDNSMTNAKAYIRNHQEENGSFEWQTGSTGDTFTTSYAIPALANKSWPIGIFNQTISATPSLSPTTVPSVTPTVTQSVTPSPTVAISPTQIPSPTDIPTVSPSPTVTLSPTMIPSESPEPTVSNTPSQGLSPTVTQGPAQTASEDKKNKKLLREINKEIRKIKHDQKTIFDQLNELEKLFAGLGKQIQALFHFHR